MAPVVVSLARAPTGLQHVTIRLAPPELGGVQIRFDHTAGTPARVEISVQRPETLALLVRDMPQLQHALHQAGVIVDAGSMVVQLDMQPPQTASGDPDTGRGRDARPEVPTGQHVAEPEDEPVAMTAPVWLRAGLDITA